MSPNLLKYACCFLLLLFGLTLLVFHAYLGSEICDGSRRWLYKKKSHNASQVKAVSEFKHSSYKCASCNHLTESANPSCTKHYHACINRQSGDDEINTNHHCGGLAVQHTKASFRTDPWEIIFRFMRHYGEHDITVYYVHNTVTDPTVSQFSWQMACP